MDKINFANTYTPSKELQLARWYTLSCILIMLMLIVMCSVYVMQWRTYQHTMHTQQTDFSRHALAHEYTQLEAQRIQRNQLRNTQTNSHYKLANLRESLGHDIYLDECVINRDGNHHLTISAPSRQRAQDCLTRLNKKQLFGPLAISAIQSIRHGEKTRLSVTIKAVPNSKA